MNYKKVIKDLKERNDSLAHQYRLRDIRCIHLEYENKMLKSDFEAQHELTKKYVKENKELKEDISFCLHSIKQEKEMSTDSRTRNEMTSCYEILKRWNK